MKKLYETIKRNTDYKALFIFINIAVFVFLFVVQYKVLRHGNLYGLIDQTFPELNPNHNLFANLFMWDSSRGVGETQYLFLMQFVEFAYVWLLSLLIHNVTVLNFVKIFLTQIFYYAGCFLFFYACLKYILKQEITYKNLSAVSVFSLAAILNIYFFQSNVGFVSNQRFDIFVFGLLFYSINRLMSMGNGWWVFILASVLSMGSWVFLPFWVPWFILTFGYAVLFSKSYKLTIKIIGTHLAVILPAIITLLFFYKGLNVQTSSIGQYKNVEFLYANANSTLLHILSFIGGVNWDQAWGWNNDQVYPYYEFYKANLFFVACSMLIFIFFIISQFYKNAKIKNFRLFFNASVLISIFMIASYNPPFGTFFTYLIGHAPLFIMFRESHNKFYPVLLLSLLAGIFLWSFSANKALKKIMIGSFVVYAAVFTYAALAYNIHSPEATFNFPQNNYAVLNSVIPSESRVLILPQYSYVKRYNFGYTGDTITRFIYNFDQFDISYLLDTNFGNTKVRDMLDNFNYEQYPKGLYNFGLPNPSFSADLLNNLAINYVVFDKNIVGDSSDSSFRYASDYISLLKGLKGFVSVLDNTDFLVMKKQYQVSEILAPQAVFKKINPTEYEVYISNISSAQNLSFLESFDPGWKLYLRTNPSSSWCVNLPKTAQSPFIGPIRPVIAELAGPLNFNAWACQAKQTFFIGNELSYFWKKPVFDSSHESTKGYANTWTIDPGYITKNFPTQYYKENPNGSINIEMTLYFKPQNDFYLALLISGLVIFGLAGLGIYKLKRGKLIKQSTNVAKI